ncbi:hypothetical protein [Furfurilactobacillus rossiae]|nr:hypothetical protein [Furfurilactobacillus rossiae]QFR67396.1 hypothetical protein LR814_09910 [Furfurilactobacillus rossiae]QLE60336.1 hypothetical protein LROSRS0_0288 [Furfurilactobacillus rossiae]
MKKRLLYYLSVNKWLVLFFFIGIVASSILGYWFFSYCSILEAEKISKSVLTMSTILTGFSYTTLGVMVNFLSNKTIKEDQKGGYLDEYFNASYLSLAFFSINIPVGFLIILDVISRLETILVFLQIFFFVIGLSVFMYLIVCYMLLIQYVRHNG